MEKKDTSSTKQRRRMQEVYIVEFAVSGTARETVTEKLKRLMVNEAGRLNSQSGAI